jgi:proteasome assembly chaperone (PAC2) family protein
MEADDKDNMRLNNPILVAVWPGMGQVAVSAGYYLAAKLGMTLLAEMTEDDLYDVDYAEVKQGLIKTGRVPRNLFFVHRDPEQKRDIVVLIGEAQPPSGKLRFCKRVLEFVSRLGGVNVFTFAAMVTSMAPEGVSRVFGAAIDESSLEDLRRWKVEVLEDGNIGGLNGVFLGVASEMGMKGACLLGETPQIFAHIPFPGASLAVLKVFSMIANVEIDTKELQERTNLFASQWSEVAGEFEQWMRREGASERSESEFEFRGDTESEPSRSRMTKEEEDAIEKLFEEAKHDRAKAYELKHELDRLQLFQDYEDRFLDLFK